MADAAAIGPATLSITQTVGAFATFLPRFSEIRQATPEENPDIAADVRMGEVAACTTAIGVAVIVSSLTGSPLPTYTAVAMCGILVALYEQTLRRHRPMERPSARVINLAEYGEQ